MWSRIFRVVGFHKEAKDCKVFHYKLLPTKNNDTIYGKETQENSILDPFFPVRRTNNFPGKSAYHLSQLDFYRCAKCWKTIELTKTKTDAPTDRHIGKHEFIRPLPEV